MMTLYLVGRDVPGVTMDQLVAAQRPLYLRKISSRKSRSAERPASNLKATLG